ncbi:hypothetical protein GQ54DRAFT_298041 [Martensiomyces pterosporus]|nr:hypothetical protein GQ54DRAFT_298041 [Martensiomyces pterosporus]
MAIRSILQILPENIIEYIIFHTTGLRPLNGSQLAEYHPELSRRLVPFLGICTHWRAVALPLFYLDMALATDFDATTIERPSTLVHGIDAVLSANVEALPRCAAIQVPFTGVITGKVSNVLSAAPYAEAVFPSVIHINYNIYGGEYLRRGDPSVSKENAVRFCGQIRRLFPNAASLRIDTGRIGIISYDELMGDIVTGISRELRAFDYQGPESYVHVAELSPRMANLTRISLSANHSDGKTIDIVRHNALSLERVELREFAVGACLRLVQAPEGRAVTYPRLKSLFIYAMDYSRVGIHELPEGTPFPALKHLHCAGDYPFANDVLFRGNSATLESLDLTISQSLLWVIQRYSLFDHNRFPRLNRLALESWENIPMDDDLALKLARVPFENRPGVQVAKVCFRGNKRDNIILDAIRLSLTGSQIQYLNIQGFKLTADEIVQVIRLLPDLKDLAFWMVEEEDPENGYRVCLDTFASSALIPQPISTRLRSLDFQSRAGGISRMTVTYIVAIAAMSPSLQYIAMLELIFDRCQQHFRDAVAEPLFAPYAQHLRSLKYLSGLYRAVEPIPLF